jgi:hypothetical protein
MAAKTKNVPTVQYVAGKFAAAKVHAANEDGSPRCGRVTTGTYKGLPIEPKTMKRGEVTCQSCLRALNAPDKPAAKARTENKTFAAKEVARNAKTDQAAEADAVVA